MEVGVEQKKKRGWPKGKPRGAKKQKVNPTEVIIISDGHDSPIQVTTPAKSDEMGTGVQSKEEQTKNVSSSLELVQTLQNFILKRMHFMYKFKTKLEEMQEQHSTQIDDSFACEALETMEAYLLKHLNRIKEFKAANCAKV